MFIKRNFLNSLSIGITLLFTILLISVFPKLISNAHPLTIDLNNSFAEFNELHPLGTDILGRDILARIIYGVKNSLFITIATMFNVIVIGLIMGILANSNNAIVRNIVNLVIDATLSLPKIIFAILIIYLIGNSNLCLILAISAISWPAIAHLVKGETNKVLQKDFITVAKLQGASQTRIIFKYVLSLVMPHVVSRVSFDASGYVLIAAGLGYLGIGLKLPEPDLGHMIAESIEYLFVKPSLYLPPGIALVLLSLTFNLIGDGIRDRMDKNVNTNQ